MELPFDEYINYLLPSNGTYYIRIFGDDTRSPYDLWWELREYSEDMIPGYDILITRRNIWGCYSNNHKVEKK